MTCNGERWVGVVCPGSEQCFAVPVDSLVCPHSLAYPSHRLTHAPVFYLHRPT